jgi:hypothetical protein
MPADQIKQLCESSKKGDLSTVKRLLSEGAAPNPKGEVYTPLM